MKYTTYHVLPNAKLDNKYSNIIIDIDNFLRETGDNRFGKLITALRTAVDNDGTLDKESASYNDIFDALGWH
jgi:hypothetical protein